MKQFCILSTNAKLEAIAWGPFGSLNSAKQIRRRLDRAYPFAKHLILPFQDVKEIPKAKDGEENGE